MSETKHFPLFDRLVESFKKAGKFTGAVNITWHGPILYDFIQDPNNPFSFIRENGQVITPENMVTDGGSVPRIFWSVGGLSPWDFLPAYIIHDWLYVQHHAGACKYEFQEVNTIMAEAIYTLMLTNPNNVYSPRDLWAIFSSVNSFAGKKVWDGSSSIPFKKEV